jgi:hypothetical protein
MKAATEGPTYPPFGSTGANKATSPRQTRPPRAEIGPSRLKEHVDRTVQLTVPAHRPIKRSSLSHILKQASLSPEQLQKLL